jgi:hypothetical protein
MRLIEPQSGNYRRAGRLTGGMLPYRSFPGLRLPDDSRSAETVYSFMARQAGYSAPSTRKPAAPVTAGKLPGWRRMKR